MRYGYNGYQMLLHKLKKVRRVAGAVQSGLSPPPNPSEASDRA